ncbi:hypothetical protein BLX87_14940 [Bacillus sp. VT-16-64]|nr:hypothetical protein BLX87_14940 [Bacillus sp. VT-16-64]
MCKIHVDLQFSTSYKARMSVESSISILVVIIYSGEKFERWSIIHHRHARNGLLPPPSVSFKALGNEIINDTIHSVFSFLLSTMIYIFFKQDGEEKHGKCFKGYEVV